jgi:hypothetical protein
LAADDDEDADEETEVITTTITTTNSTKDATTPKKKKNKKNKAETRAVETPVSPLVTPPPTPPTAAARIVETPKKAKKQPSSKDDGLKKVAATTVVVSKKPKTKGEKQHQQQVDTPSSSSTWTLFFILVLVLLHRCPTSNPTVTCKSFRSVPYMPTLVETYHANLYPVVNAVYEDTLEPVVDAVWSAIYPVAEPVYTSYVAPQVDSVYKLYATHGQPIVDSAWTGAEPIVAPLFKTVSDKWNRLVQPLLNRLVAVYQQYAHPSVLIAVDTVKSQYLDRLHPTVLQMRQAFKTELVPKVKRGIQHAVDAIVRVWVESGLEAIWYKIRIAVAAARRGEQAAKAIEQEYAQLLQKRVQADNVEKVVEEALTGEKMAAHLDAMLDQIRADGQAKEEAKKQKQ